MKKILLLLIFSFFLPFFLASQDDEFDFMHSASFKFSKGVPFIRAHIKSYPNGVEIKNRQTLTMKCGEKAVKSNSFKVFVNEFTPQKVMYKLSFAELSHNELKNHAEIVAKWKEKSGIEVEIYVHGAIFSINALKIDNREYYLTAKEMFDKSSAHEMMAKYRTLFPENNVTLIPVMTSSSKSKLTVKTQNGGSLICRNIVSLFPDGDFFVGADSYEKGPEFFLTASSAKKIELAVEDTVENLVKKILPGEMFLSAPLETLKAQAVAARTDIFMQLGKRHVSEPWHICSEVHCQKILWGQKVHQKFISAVEETEGRVIMYNGSHIARAPYCSSAGGRTEDIRFVWFTAEKPYLSGVWDGDEPLKYDLSKEDDLKKFLESDYGEDNININKRHRWKITFKQEELDELVNKTLNIGAINGIEAVARGVSGRIYKIVFRGSKRTQTVYGELNIRKMLNNMPSSAFIVSKNDGIWTFQGAGWGHGVGMSQMGAISLGGKNRDYKYILNRYYPKTEVIKIY
ncbi:MAG: SpoIID/LytB domain-containing protein [bacterium]